MEQVKEMIALASDKGDFVQQCKAVFELDAIGGLIRTCGPVHRLGKYKKDCVRGILQREEDNDPGMQGSYRYGLPLNDESLEFLVNAKKLIDELGWVDLAEDWQRTYDWFRPRYLKQLLVIPAWTSFGLKRALEVLGNDLVEDERNQLSAKIDAIETSKRTARENELRAIASAKKQRKRKL